MMMCQFRVYHWKGGRVLEERKPRDVARIVAQLDD